MTPASIRNTWKQGSWLLRPTVPTALLLTSSVRLNKPATGFCLKQATSAIYPGAWGQDQIRRGEERGPADLHWVRFTTTSHLPPQPSTSHPPPSTSHLRHSTPADRVSFFISNASKEGPSEVAGFHKRSKHFWFTRSKNNKKLPLVDLSSTKNSSWK